ncbi:MAG TPA: glycosyltransferase family 4 protein [bacterium]|nr:glycosyltransferase family 4 protein [bacterium]
MNIGIVTAWCDVGAGMVSRAYRDVLQTKHNVFIYVRGGLQPRDDPNWQAPNVTWGRQFRRGITRVALKEFHRWAVQHKLDVILFNEQWNFIPVVYARRHLDVALGTYVDYYKANTVAFFDLYDFLLCNTRRHHSVFQHHPHAVYIPWGTDCELFNGSCECVQQGSVVFFLSAGGNPVRKGAETAILGFKLLRGNCRFVLHLQRDLSSFPTLELLCRDDPRIQVVVRNVPPPGLYHHGDVYVYPSILDGIGLTIPEAMACGLPVITTDCAPMNEFVQNGVNGRLVQPYEYRTRPDGYYWPESYCRPEDVAEAMQHYVDHLDHLGEFKKQSREYARTHHDWFKNALALPEMMNGFSPSQIERQRQTELEWQALDDSYLPPMRRNFRDVLRLMNAHHGHLADWLLYSR